MLVVIKIPGPLLICCHVFNLIHFKGILAHPAVLEVGALEENTSLYQN